MGSLDRSEFMPFNFKDFFPAIVSKGIFSDEYEPFSATVARASQWLVQAGVKLVNIETVVLPNVGNEQDASEAGIRTSGSASSHWYQIVRVWYSEKGPN